MKKKLIKPIKRENNGFALYGEGNGNCGIGNANGGGYGKGSSGYSQSSK